MLGGDTMDNTQTYARIAAVLAVAGALYLYKGVAPLYAEEPVLQNIKLLCPQQVRVNTGYGLQTVLTNVSEHAVKVKKEILRNNQLVWSQTASVPAKQSFNKRLKVKGLNTPGTAKHILNVSVEK